MVADLILVGLLLILAVFGYVKCFSGILTDLLSIVCCVVATIFLTPVFVGLLNGLGLGGSLQNAFASAFAGKEGMDTVVGGDVSAMQGLQAIGIPEAISGLLSRVVDGLTPGATGTVAAVLGGVCAQLVAYLIAFILVLILVAVVFRLLKKLFDCSHKVKALRVIDGVLGLVLVLGITVVVVFLSFALLGKVGGFQETLQSTTLLRTLYEKNPLASLL